MASSDQSEEVLALNERIAEVITEFSEANTITAVEVLQSLDHVYACIEVHNKDTLGWLKMH